MSQIASKRARVMRRNFNKQATACVLWNPSDRATWLKALAPFTGDIVREADFNLAPWSLPHSPVYVIRFPAKRCDMDTYWCWALGADGVAEALVDANRLVRKAP